MLTKLFKPFLWAIGAILILFFALFIYLPTRIHPNSVPEGNPAGGISVVRLPNGRQEVKVADGDYRFTVPAEWQTESIGGGGIAVYPRGATTSSVPQCKIELSVFQNPDRISLDAWLPAHLRADPTLTVTQTSLEAREVDGISALQWAGTIEGIPTTLVYWAHGTWIYELAPSSLAADVLPTACAGYLDELRD
jgi:hypothetical protein